MHDIITIGDCMRDIFLFPELSDMEKPMTDEQIEADEHFDKFLVFGLGDKITVSDTYFSVGGTAANVAAGLTKLGFKTTIFSAVGGDSVGQEITSILKAKKVGIENVKIYKSKKSSFSVIVSYKGERTIFVYHSFSPSDFRVPEKLDTDWVYLGPMADGFEHLYNQIVSQVVKNELKVAVNPGACQIAAGLQSFGGLLKLISVIFLNREEAKAISGLTGTPNVKDMIKAIQVKGPKVVVITDGANGAYAYNGIDFYKVGAFPGARLDATGAGDSFASAFLAAMMEQESLQMCLKWGVVNSASVVGKIGAQEGLLGKSAIRKKVLAYRWPQEGLRFS